HSETEQVASDPTQDRAGNQGGEEVKDDVDEQPDDQSTGAKLWIPRAHMYECWGGPGRRTRKLSPEPSAGLPSRATLSRPPGRWPRCDGGCDAPYGRHRCAPSSPPSC